jgi:heme oxygenase
MMASTATKVESARSSGLALQLDDGTRKSHSVAENTAFVTGFFKGLSNKQSFGQLVCSLYHVYSAMEKALDETPDASVNNGLFRASAERHACH